MAAHNDSAGEAPPGFECPVFGFCRFRHPQAQSSRLDSGNLMCSCTVEAGFFTEKLTHCASMVIFQRIWWHQHHDYHPQCWHLFQSYLLSLDSSGVLHQKLCFLHFPLDCIPGKLAAWEPSEQQKRQTSAVYWGLLS